MNLALSRASRICILGRTGQGKTVLSRSLQAGYPRVLIVDLVDDYGPKDGQCFSDLRSFGEWLVQHQRAPRFRVIFKFRFTDENYREIADELFRMAFQVGNLLLVADEAQNYLHSHYLKHLILVGRRRNIAVICATQRPANISKDVISQASDLFVGKLFETNDLKYLADILNPEDIEALPGIKPFHFLHYRPGERSQVVPNQ